MAESSIAEDGHEQGADAFPPGSTIGILGGGQLGRMLAMAAAQLGFRCHIYCPEPEGPAIDVAGAHTSAAYDDETALAEFAAAVDVATYEFENVAATAVRFLADRIPVRPGVRSLVVSQDRLTEKKFLTDNGVPVAPYQAIDRPDDLDAALAGLGLPLVLKTRRFGYDGKGQVIIRARDEAATALETLGEVPAIAEKFIPFEQEISVIAVGASRSIAARDRQIVAYDVVTNVHRNHILHTATVPAAVSATVASEARRLALAIVNGLCHVGAMGVEFFVLPASGKGSDRGGDLLVNEIAPRVHNSGHWTIDACHSSQFDNHIRAITGWPLAPTKRHSNAVMTNLIGDDIEQWRQTADMANTAFHAYGKTATRPGRKMGHMTRLSPISQ